MNKKTTETSSIYNNLEKMSTLDLLHSMNAEDRKVPVAIAKCIHQIEPVVERVYAQMNQGGRLFYIGSGTSGRLGIVDASECPPTYGVPHGWVIGVIAGGDGAIRKAVEFAEDSEAQGWADLQAYDINKGDFLVGITASGTTPYVLGAVEEARKRGIPTAGITCNVDAPLSSLVEYPIEVVVGPEFVTGSTRMKAGTAQKLVLNMISTTVMIRLGRVRGNKMVDMQLSNKKLIVRGTRMIMEETGVSEDIARELLLKHQSVRLAVDDYLSSSSK